jgi:hypothetical protein
MIVAFRSIAIGMVCGATALGCGSSSSASGTSNDLGVPLAEDAGEASAGTSQNATHG